MKLTADERRRMFLAQQKANEAMRLRLAAPGPLTGGDARSGGARRSLVKPATIVLLLGTGFLALWALDVQTLHFHLPDALVEMFFPRL